MFLTNFMYMKGEVSWSCLLYLQLLLTRMFCFSFLRIKSGNPGYFVAINPTTENIVADFSGHNLPDKMTVDFVSSNFNTTEVALK